MVNVERTVFYTDVLGFSSMACEPEARPAADALSDLATLLSVEHPVARYLNRHPWERRLALSDSMFLVGCDPLEACRAATEFFFNLAFYTAGPEGLPVLARGALAHGEVRYLEPIFPETARANLVGEAVVRAVGLERLPDKGPRLFLAPEVAATVRQDSSGAAWLLSEAAGGMAELLWLLPSDPASVSPGLIGTVAMRAAALFLQHGQHPRFGAHYVGYLELVARSLLRLQQRESQSAALAAQSLALESLAVQARRLPAGDSLADLLDALTERR